MPHRRVHVLGSRGSTYQYSFEPSPGTITLPSGSGYVVSTGSDYSATIGAVTLSNWATAAPPASYIHLQNYPPLFSYTQYYLNVTITDAASGRTESANVSGFASSSWLQQPNGTWVLSVQPEMGGTSSGTLILGYTQYNVWLTTVVQPAPHSTAPLADQLNVTVIAHTPEPGTLMLAAMGVPFLGALLRRRCASTKFPTF